ncbi:putative endodeoxyribonuclease [Sporobolomyces koalae]|uniref:putative endodeoxyribonuclease n=1 Tax=Sporobolomyces koalae TaxID=500713 RepID=UPI00316C53B2
MTGWRDTRPAHLDPETRFAAPPDAQVLRRLHDAHCHPCDDVAFSSEAMNSLHTAKFCVMSSSLTNQYRTKQVVEARPADVIPCFGLHPWYSHPISFAPPKSVPTKFEHYTALFPDPNSPTEPHPTLSKLLPYLADPVSIGTFLSQLEADLEEHASSFVGEVGLDKAFKLPNPPHLALELGSKNSDLSTPIDHQTRVVEAQWNLAIRLRKNVSQHCVRSTFETVELLKRYKRDHPGFESIYVCLHSFGGSAEAARQIQKNHANVFFSFSTIISGRSPNFYKLLKSIEPDRLLLESDFSDTTRIDEQIWEIFEAVCLSREWTVDQAVEQLESNWNRFTQPADERPEPRPRKSAKQRKREKNKQDLYVSDEDNNDNKANQGV